MSFSRNTIFELVKALNFSSHSELEQFAFQYGLEEAFGSGSIKIKETNFMKYLFENQELKGPMGSNLVLEISEFLFEQKYGQNAWSPQTPEEAFPRLVNALKQDGFAIEGRKVRRGLSEIIPIANEENQMEHLLNKHGFTTALGHFSQAIAAHTKGDWAAANGQLRSFVEELFDKIASNLSDGTTDGLTKSHARREWLAKCDHPFFEKRLNEWEVGNKGGFVQGFWERLHPDGSHPGLSNETDSTFRLHLVIIVSGYYLNRFDHRTNS